MSSRERDKTPKGMDPEFYKRELEIVMKKKYNDESITQIKKRARGLLYRIDFDLFVVLNWIIDNMEEALEK
jgi:hypothetical protein